VRRGLVDSKGADALGRECEEAVAEGGGDVGTGVEPTGGSAVLGGEAGDRQELAELVQAAVDALQLLAPQPGSQNLPPEPAAGGEEGMQLDGSALSDAEQQKLAGVLGRYFGTLVAAQPAWARRLLSAVGEGKREGGEEGKEESKAEGEDVAMT